MKTNENIYNIQQQDNPSLETIKKASSDRVM